MAAGLPVVASAVGGLLDLIEPDRTGLLVPPDDADALAAALRRLFTDPALAGRLGEAAQTQVRQRYSFDRMVASFEELYTDGPGGPADGGRAPRAGGGDLNMCGIAGRFNFDRGAPVDRAQLVAMTDAVAHRGPDAGGYYLDGGIGLGHRRLSIIDLATGDQPLGNEDGIDPGRLQRRDLQLRRGARRARSRTATASAPTPTPKSSSTATSSGASAASIASAACSPSRSGTAGARRLLLARDRLGVKPLYYAEVPGGHRVRLGDQVAARGPGRAARLARRRARRLPDAALHPGARHDLPRHPQAAAGARARRRARPGAHLAVLGPRVHRRRRRGGARRTTSRSSMRTCAKPCSSA